MSEATPAATAPDGTAPDATAPRPVIQLLDQPDADACCGGGFCGI